MEYLRPKDIRSKFGLSHTTLFELENEGKLKPIKTPGGHRRYLESDVMALFHTNDSDEKILNFPLRVTKSLLLADSEIIADELRKRLKANSDQLSQADKILFSIEVIK